MLPVPTYIDLPHLRESTLDFPWNDELPHAVLGRLDARTARQMRQVSDLAKVGFVIACAEWVVYRFDGLTSVDFAWEYIEASWAKLLDPVLARPWEPREWIWSGRADGAVATALHSVTNTFYGVDEGGGWEQEIRLASSFVEHVLAAHPPFLEWRVRIVPRLVELFPYDDRHPLGSPCPRLAMEPDGPSDASTMQKAVETALASLDRSRNRFLTTPEEQEEIRAAAQDDDE